MALHGYAAWRAGDGKPAMAGKPFVYGEGDGCAVAAGRTGFGAICRCIGLGGTGLGGVVLGGVGSARSHNTVGGGPALVGAPGDIPHIAVETGHDSHTHRSGGR